MRPRWVRDLPSIATGSDMALPRLPKIGAMRSKMLKVKQAPSVKLGNLKTTTGPKRPMTRNLVGHPISHGEMI